MARGAADVALLDLGTYLRPPLLVGEAPDRESFGGRISVIEVQDDRIGLAAIDARMSEQVFDDQRSVALAMAPKAQALVLDVRRLGP